MINRFAWPLAAPLIFASALLAASKSTTRPSTRPTTTTAPTSRPSSPDAAAAVREFFDALRKQDLPGAKKLCWAPPGEFEKAFGREWPSESKKMASGKRVVAVVEGKEAGDLAIVMFHEDVTDKNLGAKLEPLWLVKRDGVWKLLIGVNANVLSSLPKERAQSGELRTWFRERKQQIVESHKAAPDAPVKQ